ncbi:LOW QUALITY PROTEIN: coiled-coil domain-containing protein 9, partial [Opisthocomus hoazin]|uniref:LOW QUALITY PROTEIN: coiled-coil domain-containing protein 9 n=1 Tax=Opisthocomus hoazin TaxID=30419 RepID=UPI003F53425E
DGLHEKNPVRNFLDDPRRSGPFQDADRKDGSRRHVRNWGGPDFDKVKAGMEREKTWQGPGRRSSPKAGGPLDMTLSMTGRERAEYVRWKKEREQIDRERLARHRNPTGQWRREWDAEKSDSMFKEGSAAAPGSEAGGGEETRRPPPKAPTFGEFLSPRRAQRRKKSRGRGVGSKPYSMHDNRWEEKELPAPSEEAESRKAEEAASGTLPQPPPSLSPEEDEDQWEDVSEEEEEEEGGSPGSSSEDEAPRSASPKAQRPPKLRGPPSAAAAAPEWGAGTPPEPLLPRGRPPAHLGLGRGDGPGLSPQQPGGGSPLGSHCPQVARGFRRDSRPEPCGDGWAPPGGAEPFGPPLWGSNEAEHGARGSGGEPGEGRDARSRGGGPRHGGDHGLRAGRPSAPTSSRGPAVTRVSPAVTATARSEPPALSPGSAAAAGEDPGERLGGRAAGETPSLRLRKRPAAARGEPAFAQPPSFCSWGGGGVSPPGGRCGSSWGVG